MKLRKGLVAACLIGALVACTPGAPSQPAGAQGPVPGATIIQVSLLTYKPMASPDGTVAGYANAHITVPVGTIIQFHNQDNFLHTASLVSTTSFPKNNSNPLTNTARTQNGSDLATAGWSTGDLNADAYSQPLTASQAGKYFYGCFFHYSTPMRGVIIVQ